MPGVDTRPLYERFNIHHRLQHFLMLAGFLICTFTGLPIKYSYSWWAPRVTAIFGGFETMFSIHLFGAVLMIISSLYHLGYLALYPLVKKKVMLSTLPAIKDVVDLFQEIKYYLGFSQEKPQFDRYSYREKFDYWAVFWGMLIMVVSGLMMWFPGAAIKYFPLWFIESARVAHSDEAILAILAIFIWHFYNVHFNPDFFPMNGVWLHGKISYQLMQHEHPAELARIIEQDENLEEIHDKHIQLGKYSNNKALIIFQLVFYALILVWFFVEFLPLGMM